MRLKKIFFLCLTIILVSALSGCVDQHRKSAGGGAENKNTGEAARLVATSPAGVAICDRLKLELIGVCDTNGTMPERYKNVTRVGMAMSPDLEVIKSLKPDYVLSPNSLQNDLQPKYASIGVSALFLDLRSVDGMYASIDALGDKFGCRAEADKLIDEYNAFMEEYREKNKGKNSPKVLVLMGLPGSYIVATDNSYVGSLVKLAGGTNVYGDGDGKEFLIVNTEDIKTKEPDVIVRAAHGLPEKAREMFAKEFETNDIWKHFKAVQSGRVYDLDPDVFGMSATFRYPEALEALESILYAEDES